MRGGVTSQGMCSAAYEASLAFIAASFNAIRASSISAGEGRSFKNLDFHDDENTTGLMMGTVPSRVDDDDGNDDGYDDGNDDDDDDDDDGDDADGDAKSAAM